MQHHAFPSEFAFFANCWRKAATVPIAGFTEFLGQGVIITSFFPPYRLKKDNIGFNTKLKLSDKPQTARSILPFKASLKHPQGKQDGFSNALELINQFLVEFISIFITDQVWFFGGPIS